MNFRPPAPSLTLPNPSRPRFLAAAGVFMVLLLAGCSASIGGAPSAPAPSDTAAGGQSGPTVSPAGVSPTAIASPALASPAPPQVAQPSSMYVDDRSSPWAVLESYANALGSRQYLRAYGYWQPGPGAPDYPAFQAANRDVTGAEVQIGAVTVDRGAGQTYWWAPVTLTTNATGSTPAVEAGCIALHLGLPSAQVPPFRGISISKATLLSIPGGADARAVRDQACREAGAGGGMPATPPAAASGIGSDQYVDNRTTPETVLRSLFNAVNRHEYARAYGYWDPRTPGLPAFADFEAGYRDTSLVALQTGQVTSDVGAGQLNYRVPAVLTATLTSGATQTFAGCYQLHLSQPLIQATPPFQPLAVRQAEVREVTGTVDEQALLKDACR